MNVKANMMFHDLLRCFLLLFLFLLQLPDPLLQLVQMRVRTVGDQVSHGLTQVVQVVNVGTAGPLTGENSPGHPVQAVWPRVLGVCLVSQVHRHGDGVVVRGVEQGGVLAVAALLPVVQLLPHPALPDRVLHVVGHPPHLALLLCRQEVDDSPRIARDPPVVLTPPPEPPAVALDMTDQLLSVGKPNLPHQRPVAKHPHGYNVTAQIKY